jgi:hypothetical protein
MSGAHNDDVLGMMYKGTWYPVEDADGRADFSALPREAEHYLTNLALRDAKNYGPAARELLEQAAEMRAEKQTKRN